MEELLVSKEEDRTHVFFHEFVDDKLDFVLEKEVEKCSKL